MEKLETQKDFDLGAILTLTSKRIYADFDSIYEILEYLTGSVIFSHLIPKALETTRLYVLSIYPQLKGIGVSEEFDSPVDALAFVEEQKKIFGEKLPLKPMTKDDVYTHDDLVNEIIEIKYGGKR